MSYRQKRDGFDLSIENSSADPDTNDRVGRAD